MQLTCVSKKIQLQKGMRFDQKPLVHGIPMIPKETKCINYLMSKDCEEMLYDIDI